MSRSPPIDLQPPLIPASWERFQGKLSTALRRVRRRWQIDAPCCERRSAPQMHFMCRRPVFSCLPKAVLSEWITTLNKYDSQLMHRPHGEHMKMILITASAHNRNNSDTVQSFTDFWKVFNKTPWLSYHMWIQLKNSCRCYFETVFCQATRSVQLQSDVAKDSDMNGYSIFCST